ncbi:diguanylate cyclase [Thiomicrorhabdus sp. ZW0627]|uniref:sensor domain-containing diguanylate cyclase n=1 Tax=Thiomicrorhabdus sp. ZW0627 TaxID=3039774 RepID=UPI002436DB55|nr:sensor domain-containing diguanylate cyclase [Thiomicrorhabdus sp. ZW0627]MDG6774480.1 diguanylate cyclase [Thiomicrorhabdus sp. ZW0627]
MRRIISSFSIQPLLLITWSLLAAFSLHLMHPLPFLQPTIEQLPLSVQEQIMLLLLLLAVFYGVMLLQNRQLQQRLNEQEQRYKKTVKELKSRYQNEENQIITLMQSDQFAYWEWDIKKNQADFSPQWKSMLGLEKDLPLNSLNDLKNRIHPKDQSAVQKQMLKILSGEHQRFECTHRVRHEDGHYLWVHDKGQIFYSPYGDIEKLSAIRLDVSEQKWIEEELELDATIIEHSSEGIVIADEQLKVVRCNQALAKSLDLDRDAIQHMSLEQLLELLQNGRPSDILSQLEHNNQWRGELSVHRANGKLDHASIVNIQKILHETTQRIHYILTHTDITDLKRTEHALNNLANLDSVTGLANRNKLYNELEKTLAQDTPTTLLFLDLDNFKTVNDTLGHDIGDQLLQNVGEILTSLIPESALAARVGGDEFVLFYDRDETEMSASELANSIGKRLGQPITVNQHEIQVGSSIGIAHYPEDAEDRKSLMKAADTAMYQAKRAGKGQFRVFSDNSPTSQLDLTFQVQTTHPEKEQARLE